MKQPKRRMHLKGPHNIILLCRRMGVDESGVYGMFFMPPAGLTFHAPSGAAFVTDGRDILVYDRATA